MQSPSTGAPLPVEGFMVSSSVLNSNVVVAGSLLPFEETEIHPEVAGKGSALSIQEGAVVKKRNLAWQGFLMAIYRRNFNKLSVQLKIAQKTQERQDELLKIGGISQQDFDLSLLNVSTIKADMQILQASIDKTIIRAPFDGKLGLKNISIGAYITPPTILTTISQVNKLKLEFSVPEKYTQKVAVGNFISFSTETSPKTYSGRNHSYGIRHYPGKQKFDSTCDC